MLKLNDVKSNKVILEKENAHVNGVSYCDFNKYNTTIVTGGGDCALKIWDIRNMSNCVMELVGHRYNIKKCIFSNFSENVLVSCS